MEKKDNPFDEGHSESDLIESAYQSVKNAKFSFSLVPVALVKRVHRNMAKRLYYDEPTQAIDFSKEALPFLTLSSAVIEEKSTELIIENIIEEEYQEKGSIQSEISGWSQGKREDKLIQLGLIDSELKEKLTAVRKTRNNLVHDPDKHHSLEDVEYKSHTLPEVIEMALECAEELDSRVINSDLTYDE